MGELLSEVGDIVFTLVIGYIGAIEFLYVVRHLYHWTFRHPTVQGANDDGNQALKGLTDKLRTELQEAELREKNAGAKAMQDGVLYKDGFRIDPQQAGINDLKDHIKSQEQKAQKRKELEVELARQKAIEEETRKQLEAAEAELKRQREEKLREAKEADEATENERKIIEAKRQREAEQRQREEEAENERKLIEAERQREAEQRQREEAAENERKLIEAERQREADQRQREENEKNERRLIEDERQREAEQREREEAESQREAEKHQTKTDTDSSTKLLEAEVVAAQESSIADRERKQKLIEENARKFLEAEQEMVQLQQQMAKSPSRPRGDFGTPVEEAPCVRRNAAMQQTAPPDERLTQTLKTQFGQTSGDSYALSTKPLLFPGVSDDGSSVEPNSSKQSSFSTQPSDAEFSQFERAEPDGEDNNPALQYTDEYLRSLDGIKHRPLMREDGSGRRRAFKKRRSSGSSNSSRDSRTSREEEIKMFTSLEEEELQHSVKGENDYAPIKYTNEPMLKVKGHQHHRRRKRSPPAKDLRASDDSSRASLEMLGEEATNPWGEGVPEPYKNTDFWKREKAMSIDEEEVEFEKPAEVGVDSAGNLLLPKKSSFEEATHKQNEEAITTLQKQLSKEVEENASVEANAASSSSDTKTNLQLQASQNTEDNVSFRGRSASPQLRRSPRIDEMEQYAATWEEKANQNAAGAPTINIEPAADTAPWRDQYGLLMEGISDFYDFTASVNPSRSRSTSRNPSPAKSTPNTRGPQNVGYEHEVHGEALSTVDVYDDTGNLIDCDFKRESIQNFIESFNSEMSSANQQWEFAANEASSLPELILQNVADDPSSTGVDLQTTYPLRTHDTESDVIAEDSEQQFSKELPLRSSEKNEQSQDSMNELIGRSTSRSRSRSPLPTEHNLQRSLEVRRTKLIKHNDEILEKLSQAGSGSDTDGEGNPSISTNPKDDCTQDQMTLLVQSLRAEQSASRARSRSPLPTADNLQRSVEGRRNKLIKHNDEILEKLTQSSPSPERVTEHGTGSPSLGTVGTDSFLEETKEDMNVLAQSLRVEQSRQRSRSRSPLPTEHNLQKSLKVRRHKLIQHNDELFEKLNENLEPREATKTKMRATPTIQVEDMDMEEDRTIVNILRAVEEDDCSYEGMTRLVESLRIARSRSRSKSPMQLTGASEPQELRTERKSRSRSRSRSRTQCRSQSPSPSPNRLVDTGSSEFMDSFQPTDYSDFHMMLNLEASDNRTLLKNSEELESSLAEKQRRVDAEALDKLRTASEETELRTLTPTRLDGDSETADRLGDLPRNERLRQLRCSPTTPDYDRTISEELQDVQRIKKERLSKGFKRSTYVGESMELGSEFEELRREAAQFRRSQSPTPSFKGTELLEMSRHKAAEQRQVQAEILAELAASSKTTEDQERTQGAVRKTDATFKWGLSEEQLDTRRIREEQLSSGFKRSTYVGESLDMSAHFEERRREAAEFRRSRSRSRSPLDADEVKAIENIDIEAAKRELQDKILDEITKTTINFQEFSRHLNSDFLDNERRASDSALIQKPEILIQLQDSDLDMEPEEYHHFRRFSLNQEQPSEEYPSDEDYVYVSEIKVRSLTGETTWLREDFYAQKLEQLEEAYEAVEDAEMQESNPHNLALAEAEEHDETDGSEDERQTVVEVEDEIDEDICDFNERGPTDESHHEQSECEEAERELDRYAGRGASDWADVQNVEELLYFGLAESNSNISQDEDEEAGAVGGLARSSAACDADSYAIDQIYDDAIRNRKQSGILRDYDCILQEMQNSFLDRSGADDVDNDRYALWAKTRELERLNFDRESGIEFTKKFLQNERNEQDMRYLGNAEVSARQAARLRSRYGFAPVLSNGTAVEDLVVDLNYKPKREYNWRKNFKLDDETQEQHQMQHRDAESSLQGPNETEVAEDVLCLDFRKYSLGGESITLFSRSPDREKPYEVLIEDAEELNTVNELSKANTTEKSEKIPKKKKNLKKTRKETKISNQDLAQIDDDDSESQIYSRRSSSLQLETDSPKRKSRSRKNSKTSLNSEEHGAIYSPRSSVGFNESIPNISEECQDTTSSVAVKKKALKKRKKAKETKKEELEPQLEISEFLAEQPATASAAVSPASVGTHLLSTLSPEHSICVTPASMEEESVPNAAPTAPAAPATTIPVDTFDILKDANFYPLF